MKIKGLMLAGALVAAANGNAQAYGSGVDGQSVFAIGTPQTVAVTSSSLRSAALVSSTRIIRAFTTSDAYIVTGNSATTVTSMTGVPLPAYSAEYFKVNPGTGNYVAVIRDSADGVLKITEMKP